MSFFVILDANIYTFLIDWYVIVEDAHYVSEVWTLEYENLIINIFIENSPFSTDIEHIIVETTFLSTLKCLSTPTIYLIKPIQCNTVYIHYLRYQL